LSRKVCSPGFPLACSCAKRRQCGQRQPVGDAQRHARDKKPDMPAQARTRQPRCTIRSSCTGGFRVTAQFPCLRAAVEALSPARTASWSSYCGKHLNRL
jgi:hypothetical protein